MHPIQDLFLESFSYVLLFDMHFYMHSYVDKNCILVKSGCYTLPPGRPGPPPALPTLARPNLADRLAACEGANFFVFLILY
jgi:hypothetical protein